MAPSSQRQYYKYWITFISFIHEHFNIRPHTCTSYHVQHFITYLFQYLHLSISTIRCYLSGICFYTKLNTNLPVDPTRSFGISRLLRSYANQPTSSLVPKPISNRMLQELISDIWSLPLTDYYKLTYSNIYYVCTMPHSEFQKSVPPLLKYILYNFIKVFETSTHLFKQWGTLR